mgnify:CR=1 FL=1
MYCPLISGREKAYAFGKCRTDECALWDESHDQCAIKTFLIPSKQPSKIEVSDLENLMMIDDVIKNLTRTSQNIVKECENYLEKEGRL